MANTPARQALLLTELIEAGLIVGAEVDWEASFYDKETETDIHPRVRGWKKFPKLEDGTPDSEISVVVDGRRIRDMLKTSFVGISRRKRQVLLRRRRRWWKLQNQHQRLSLLLHLQKLRLLLTPHLPSPPHVRQFRHVGKGFDVDSVTLEVFQ
jgi:hypothetical protein